MSVFACYFWQCALRSEVQYLKRAVAIYSEKGVPPGTRFSAPSLAFIAHAIGGLRWSTIAVYLLLPFQWDRDWGVLEDEAALEKSWEGKSCEVVVLKGSGQLDAEGTCGYHFHWYGHSKACGHANGRET